MYPDRRRYARANNNNNIIIMQKENARTRGGGARLYILLYLKTYTRTVPAMRSLFTDTASTRSSYDDAELRGEKFIVAAACRINGSNASRSLCCSASSSAYFACPCALA